MDFRSQSLVKNLPRSRSQNFITKPGLGSKIIFYRRAWLWTIAQARKPHFHSQAQPKPKIWIFISLRLAKALTMPYQGQDLWILITEPGQGSTKAKIWESRSQDLLRPHQSQKPEFSITEPGQGSTKAKILESRSQDLVETSPTSNTRIFDHRARSRPKAGPKHGFSFASLAKECVQTIWNEGKILKGLG